MKSVKVNKKVNRKTPAATGSGVEILLMKCSNLDRRNLQKLCLKINIKRSLNVILRKRYVLVYILI